MLFPQGQYLLLCPLDIAIPLDGQGYKPVDRLKYSVFSKIRYCRTIVFILEKTSSRLGGLEAI